MISKIKEMHDGRLDVLIPNAAASAHLGYQLDIKERTYDVMMDLNLKSVFFLI